MITFVYLHRLQRLPFCAFILYDSFTGDICKTNTITLSKQYNAIPLSSYLTPEQRRNIFKAPLLHDILLRSRWTTPTEGCTLRR